MLKAVREHHSADETTVELIVDRLCEEFEANATSFNEARFRAACAEVR